MSLQTAYDSRITPEFLYECAKVGMVSLYSSQVVICSKNDLNMKDLNIPSCFFIEWIGTDGDLVKVNLKLKGSDADA